MHYSSILMASNGLSLDEIKMWNVEALKAFCRQRNLKLSGRKAELVARVFAASEMNVKIEPTAEERCREVQEAKSKLLKTPDGILPDPDGLKDCWLTEGEGITTWPPIYLSDITIFLMQEHPGKEVNLHKRVLNEYKEGKAYRLFEAGWLKEVYMHSITSDCRYCFLKTKCTHTMKILDIPHTIWISAHKSSGEILNAYCTCAAG